MPPPTPSAELDMTVDIVPSTTSTQANDAAAAVENPPQSRLLQLPAELRIHIYRCYFDELAGLKTGQTTKWPKDGYRLLPLLRLNSQTRKEACPVFYQEYVGHAGSARPHRWVLQSANAATTVKREAAVRELLAEHSPGFGSFCWFPAWVRMSTCFEVMSAILEARLVPPSYVVCALIPRRDEGIPGEWN